MGGKRAPASKQTGGRIDELLSQGSEGDVRSDLIRLGVLHAIVLLAQTLHLGGARLALRVTQEALLSGLQKLLRPPVVQIRGESFPAIQRGGLLYGT